MIAAMLIPSGMLTPFSLRFLSLFPRRSATKTASFPSLHRRGNSPFLHFRGHGKICIFQICAHDAEKMAGSPEGRPALWRGFPIGARSPCWPEESKETGGFVAHDFHGKSSVLYLCTAVGGKGDCAPPQADSFSGHRADGWCVYTHRRFCEIRLTGKGGKIAFSR